MDFKACAAAMITAIPELWHSPWPGAPATRGRNEEVPGICEVPKTASMSLASRIVGTDLPQLARNADGIPDMHRPTLTPWPPTSAADRQLLVHGPIATLLLLFLRPRTLNQ